MPTTKRRYRKTKGRKRPYRRRYKRKIGRALTSPNGVLPSRIVTKLKYYQEVSITLPTGTDGSYQFNLNSLYDPDFTGVGHQPYGFDELSNFYSRYRVFKCRWFINIPSVADKMFYVVRPCNGAYTFNTCADVAEQPRAVVKSTGFNGTPSAVFRGSVYLPMLGGDKRAEYKSDSRFLGTNTSSPSEVMRLVIGARNDGGPTQTPVINVTLIYYAELYDPFTLNPS